MRNMRKGLIGLVGLLVALILFAGIPIASAFDDEPDAQMQAKVIANMLKRQGYTVTLTYEAGWYVINAKNTPLRYQMENLVIHITESDPIPIK